jgi:hypothetical protein
MEKYEEAAAQYDIQTLQAAITHLAKRPGDDIVKDAGHPPSAKKRICVDFDATLYPFGELLGYDREPLSGAREAMLAMRKKGFKLTIFTSRMSPSWWEAEGWGPEAGEIQSEYIKSLLDRDGIPFDEITGEKIPALCYIDDKAIEFTGDNWPEIQERVMSL